MIFIVSGEGPSDIGSCMNGRGECCGSEFSPGSMAALVDKIVEPIVGFSVMESSALDFVSESTRLSLAKALPKTFLPGKKRAKGGAYFFKEARALAILAKRRSSERQCPVGAVLFHDADGTRSTERGLFENKWRSIEDGFHAEEFNYGVPMVPKPKSEAWLLCALQREPYHHCSQLEVELSGNDNSPNPAKDILEAQLAARGNTLSDLPDMVRSGAIDATRIDMESFNRFQRRLEQVAKDMLRSHSQ